MRAGRRRHEATRAAMADPGTLYCRFIDSVNHRALNDLNEFMAADVVQHAPDRSVGIEAARQKLADWLAMFPDAHLVIEDLVVEGDHLMAWLTATGTRRDPAVGAESTGKHVRASVFEVWSVQAGRCVERWLHVEAGVCPGDPADVGPARANASQGPPPSTRRVPRRGDPL